MEGQGAFKVGHYYADTPETSSPGLRRNPGEGKLRSSHRQQLLFASVPGMPLSAETLLASHRTGRDEIEARLLDAFPQVTPLVPSHWEVIDRFKDGSFGMSLASFYLYSNGQNLRGRSHVCPAGLLYHDGEVLFSVGIFRRTLASDRWHLMVSAPRGAGAEERVHEFLARAAPLTNGLGAENYIRHLTAEQRDTFYGLGYDPVEVSPWDPVAPAEDETLNHRLVRLTDLVEIGPDGTLVVKTLQNSQAKRFRTKARLAYNRFTNFLERSGLRFRMREYRASDAELGESMVRAHFGELIDPVGSTPEDYMNLVRLAPEDAGPGYFGRIAFVEGLGEPIPLSLFIGERTGPGTVALYATFTRRSPGPLEGRVDLTGFTAAPQYAYLRVFEELQGMGVEFADLGGSETEPLDRFKAQLGAKEVPTYWVVHSMK